MPLALSTPILVRGLVPIRNKRTIAIVTANGDNMACEGIINIRTSLVNDCDNPVSISALVFVLCGQLERERRERNRSPDFRLAAVITSTCANPSQTNFRRDKEWTKMSVVKLLRLSITHGKGPEEEKPGDTELVQSLRLQSSGIYPVRSRVSCLYRSTTSNSRTILQETAKNIDI